MKNILIYLFGCLLGLSACNKLELPNESDKTEDRPETPVNPDGNSDTLSVAQAMKQNSENFVLLKGYMVGYVKGTSIKTGANFDLPDYENSNFLVADGPSETNPEKCLAVKLEKTGKFACREELNLLDHPDFLHKGVIIEGWLSKYFGKSGITRIFGCEIFIDDDKNNGNNEDSSEEEQNGNKENNEDTDNENNEHTDTSSGVDSLQVDDKEQLVPDGRNIKK